MNSQERPAIYQPTPSKLRSKLFGNSPSPLKVSPPKFPKMDIKDEAQEEVKKQKIMRDAYLAAQREKALKNGENVNDEKHDEGST